MNKLRQPPKVETSDWQRVDETSLRRVAEVFGRSGAAGQALRAGYSMEQRGEPVEYYNTGSAIIPVSLQGALI